MSTRLGQHSLPTGKPTLQTGDVPCLQDGRGGIRVRRHVQEGFINDG